jgi:hypothetical protein
LADAPALSIIMVRTLTPVTEAGADQPLQSPKTSAPGACKNTVLFIWLSLIQEFLFRWQDIGQQLEGFFRACSFAGEDFQIKLSGC